MEDRGTSWRAVFSTAEHEPNVTQGEEPHTRHIEQERRTKHVAIAADRARQVVDQKVYLAQGAQAEWDIQGGVRWKGRYR